MSTTMAIIRTVRSGLIRGLGAALVSGVLAVTGVAGCSVYPAAPAQPAFDTDVLPIFQAHCTRCHDNNLDGGANNIVNVPAMGGPVAATAPALSQFGPCVVPDGGGTPHCGIGAVAYRIQIQQYVHYADSNTLRMPPAPSRPLDDWELQVIDAWTTQTPIPICSKSANPDPALLCP
jgi:hypothetical protein